MATTETVRTPPTTVPGGRAAGLAIGLGSAAAFALSGSFGHALLEDGWSPAHVNVVAQRDDDDSLLQEVRRLISRRRASVPDAVAVLVRI